MRVLFPLVALLAGTQQALSSSLSKRAGLDVCANLDVPCSLPNPLTGKPISFGQFGACVCLSQIPALVKSNPILVAASLIVGTSKVTSYLTNLVTSKGSNCGCPDHATLVCSKNNPCDFTCNDGYTPYGGKCVCKPPYKECNGKCGSFPYCPSKTPHKRDVEEWKRNVLCENGYTACGVLGRSKLTKQAYECVDAKNNLESCGGCSIPLHRGSPQGVDCTSLPGVADVSCMSGSCYVEKCAPGYVLAADNSMCLDEETVNKFTTIGEYGWELLVPMGLN